MKKLLVKIRNKRLKGNISLLVIIILLASSVISLLSINQIQRLITYGNQTFNYFRAFYLAKAGTELGLTEIYNSENGFHHRVESGSLIVSGNLLPEYSGFNPYFDMTITGSFYTLTDDIRYPCNSGNKIRLATGAGIMLSLFSDDTEEKGSLKNILSEVPDDKKINNLSDFENLSFDNHLNSNLTFAFFTYSSTGEMTNIVVDNNVNNLGSFLNGIEIDNNEKGYLTIKNSGEQPVEFCINMGAGELIPYSNLLVTVFGHYGDMEVGIQSIVKKGVPDWALNVIYD